MVSSVLMGLLKHPWYNCVILIMTGNMTSLNSSEDLQLQNNRLECLGHLHFGQMVTHL